MKRYWRGVFFSAVILVAIRMTGYFFPYGKVNGLFGHSAGRTLEFVVINGLLVFAVVPLILHFFES